MELKRIDTREALEQLGGSKKLYKTLLIGFSNRYSKVDKDIMSLADEKNFDEARRLSHSMKGLSGNLGASKLRECALELEHVFKDREEYDNKLDGFSKELKEVLKEVDYLIKCYEAEDKKKDCTFLEISKDDFTYICKELLSALNTFKFGEVNRAYEKFKNIKFPEKYKQLLVSVRNNIEEYNYGAAAQELKKIV